jgi:hypothetical protein
MLIEERRRAILEILRTQGHVLVAELGKRFRSSQVTIRKDLEILHSSGKIHRNIGGALAASRASTGRSHAASKGEAASRGKDSDCNCGGANAGRRAGGDSGLWNNHHRHRESAPPSLQPDHHHQRSEYRSETSRLASMFTMV